jgi:hypothetical protein
MESYHTTPLPKIQHSLFCSAFIVIYKDSEGLVSDTSPSPITFFPIHSFLAQRPACLSSTTSGMLLISLLVLAGPSIWCTFLPGNSGADSDLLHVFAQCVLPNGLTQLQNLAFQPDFFQSWAYLSPFILLVSGV